MKPATTLSDALTDKSLFGATFAAESFWTWRTVAKLIDGIPLTEPREIELFRQCTGRTKLPDGPVRRLIALVGRRGGKDRFMSAVAVWRAALSQDWRQHISAGEQAVVLLLGADRKQAAILRKYCDGLLRSPLLRRPLLSKEVARSTDDVIEFKNGGSLEIATNDARLIRGRSAIAVLGSECCYWRTDETAASSDEEVVGAAEPSMAMSPDGGVLILASSVYRKRGYMYRQFKKLHGKDDSEDICWFAPSSVMNPKLPQRVVDKAVADDAPKARAEFLNIWREDVSDFLPLDVIEGATDWGVDERPPQPGIKYVAFADAASGTGQDSFAMAIGHVEDNRVVIDLIRERKPRFVAADVIAEYADILRSYGIGEVVSDNYAGGFAADEWWRNDIRRKKPQNDTSDNFLGALPALTSKRGHLLDNVTLRTQLSGLERRVHSGHETVGHQHVASAHDDIAAAVCGCLVEAGRARQKVKHHWASVQTMRSDVGPEFNAGHLGGDMGPRGPHIDFSDPDDPWRRAILGKKPDTSNERGF